MTASSPPADLFQAARAGDIEAVRRYLREGADVNAKNDRGLTALHCAAIACNKADTGPGTAVIRLLLEAGASPNAVSADGRSVLYLTAEMSWTTEPVEVLVAAGASPDVTSPHGIHVVTNALAKDVKEYLSKLTGKPVPPPRVVRKDVKLGFIEWRKAKTQLDRVFATLQRSGLVALQNAGTTQEDGFSDCAEVFEAQGGVKAGLKGFCFYTSQDRARAKASGLLPLAFWGAPEGDNESMVQVGRIVVDAFRAAGFAVEWNGTPAERPTVTLKASDEH